MGLLAFAGVEETLEAVLFGPPTTETIDPFVLGDGHVPLRFLDPNQNT